MSLPNAKKRKIFDGRYEVLSIAGRGSDSVVYHAKHLAGSQQEVALKVLINNKPKNTLTERLRKEALTLVSCRHKYVVRLDDFHSVADLCYLSMEYAPLGDLRKYLSGAGKPLSPEQGALFLRQSLEALDFVHATGVLHRDIKPDNILVINEKEIRLADFGLALLPGDDIDLTELKNGVGSLAYLAPELLQGERYDTQSDLYSLGICFYEALAGSHPFEQATLSEQLSAREDANIKPLNEVNPSIPAGLSAVISTLLRFSARDRFSSAMEALRALANPDFSASSATTAPAGLSPETSDPFADLFDTSDLEESPEYGASNDDSYEPFSLDQEQHHYTVEPPSARRSDLGSPRATEEIPPHEVQEILSLSEATPEAVEERVNHHETHEGREHSGIEGSSDTFRKTSYRTPLLSLPPSIIRIIGVAGIAACVTIGIVSTLHALRSKSDITPEKQAAGSSLVQSASLTQGEPEGLFPRLAAGLYAGSITGVLPDTTSPLALISRPEQNTLTVVVGIEGWAPVTVSTSSESDSQNNFILVRTNGVILKIAGDNSSGELSGTFTNSITGETGVWRAKRMS